jgi:hypothetical protein
MQTRDLSSYRRSFPSFHSPTPSKFQHFTGFQKVKKKIPPVVFIPTEYAGDCNVWYRLPTKLFLCSKNQPLKHFLCTASCKMCGRTSDQMETLALIGAHTLLVVFNLLFVSSLAPGLSYLSEQFPITLLRAPGGDQPKAPAFPCR